MNLPYFNSYTYHLEPVAAPRQSRRDKWAPRPCVVRYRLFRDKVKELGISVQDGDEIVFSIQMPKSWSKKKKLEFDGQPHRQKPDLDNLLKALLDAIYENDAHVWRLTVEKRWSDSSSITIRSKH